MKRACFIRLLLCLTATFLLSQSHPVALINSGARIVPPGTVSPVSASQADPKAQAKILDQYGKLPLSFEANHGQADGRVKFLSRTGGYTLFLMGDEAVLALRGEKAAAKAKSKFPVETRLAASSAEAESKSNPIPESATGTVLRMKLRNANPAAKITGTDELPGTSNYFIGNDPTKWRTSVPTYAKVKYEGIYSGIDLVYYGNQRQLEYDFIVAPGADPRRIAFDVSGARRIRRDAHGDLVLRMETGEDEIRWHKPVVYQQKDGARQLVAARYAITDENRVGFEVAKYDASRPLYIDPLIYSTYLGGSADDRGLSIAADSAGNAYVTGWTQSSDFPITPGAFQTVCNGGINCGNAFVTKINPSGSALVYSTYLGGSGGAAGDGIAVDSVGNAYVTGTTDSADFPTMNPLQPAFGGGGSDAFVAKINPAGSALIYSTYLGGSGGDSGIRIALDSARNAYVIGSTLSTDFPTMNPLQPTSGGGFDTFVTKINPAGSALVYSTYLGGSSYDLGRDIAVDNAGNAYVTGDTSSANFPVTSGAFQAVCNRGSHCSTFGDAFVSKINTAGSALVYSTYLGGKGSDSGAGIAVDSAGNAYVAGTTYSGDFPTVNSLQTKEGAAVAFVTKFNPAGSALVYSTYLGGSRFNYGGGIAIDKSGNAYIIGSTTSKYFPMANPLQKRYGGGAEDAFVTKINSSGSAFVYSTYLGGAGEDVGSSITVDSAGNAYVTGWTASTNFPTANPLQPANAGGAFDAFVAKLYIAAATTTTLTSSPNPSAYGQAVTFTAAVTSGLGAPPDGETVTFKKGTKVLGTGTLSGGSASFTTSALPVGASYIKAVYGGDSNFAGSTSKVVKQVVN